MKKIVELVLMEKEKEEKLKRKLKGIRKDIMSTKDIAKRLRKKTKEKEEEE
ncbi:MAG: hypothetical protein KGY45_00860 [Hadesarchaea archaeon]|nr:hypothetical protein [Hadesarchaea archaeon]